MPVKTFFAPPEDPAGITFNTLNLTVFDNGLQNKIKKQIYFIRFCKCDEK
jgi:hypothetical protein